MEPLAAARLIATIPSACVLGEGPVWDDRLGCLWFTDIQQSRLLRWDHGAGQLYRFDLAERLGSIALTADPGQLLCAFASGFAMFRPETGAVHWLDRVEADYRGIRMNDGRADRTGRFWAGSMVENAGRAGAAAGSLYCLDPAAAGRARAMRGGIAISNSIAFSPDGAFVYFADTPTQSILRYPCPPAGAALGEGEVFARLSGDRWPDGSDVDAQGRLWNAEWGGWRITGYGPDGAVDAVLEVPVSQPTCIAFGGPELDLMFVTSAREGLDEARLEAEPHAGDVLVYAGVSRGLAACRFAASLAAAHVSGLLVLAGALLAAFAPGAAHAGTLALDPPFSDNAVIQRGKPVNVHGSADPGASVAVSLGAAERTVSAGADGRWSAGFPPLASGQGLDLVARAGAQEAAAHGLAVGDVFLCSGQSNMQFKLSEAALRPEQRKAKTDAAIRLFAVDQAASRLPRRDFERPPQWRSASDAGADFSAVCLLFGRQVAAAKQVPVGLIGSYWGATPIESWLPRGGLAAVPALLPKARMLDAFAADPAAAEVRFGAELDRLWANQGGSEGRIGYANINNAMIAPLGDYALAGVLWYQGENNANRGDDTATYQAKLAALMASWRGQFGADLPFVIVELAAFGPRPDARRDAAWAGVREAQRQAVLADRQAALVVTIDVGERLDIHPPLKLPVAQRAFQAARQVVYGEAAAPSGPEARAAIRERGAVRLTVANAVGALTAASWGRPGPFMLCRGNGAGEQCRFADARLDAGVIRVAVPRGFVPDRLRYCWGGAPLCNVFDGAQLPLGPFELPVQTATASAAGQGRGAADLGAKPR